MRRNRLKIVLPVLLAAILTVCYVVSGCKGDGPVWEGVPEYPAGQIPEGAFVDGFAVAQTDDPNVKVMMVHESGEGLLAITEVDALGNITNVPGAVLIGPDGDTFTVRFDAIGWPKHAVYGDNVYLFANWNDTDVDLAIVFPDGTYWVDENVGRGVASYLCPMAKPWMPVELGDSESLEEGGEIDLDSLEPLTGFTIDRDELYQLSQYGRAMQSYGYSIIPVNYSVFPRAYSTVPTTQPPDTVWRYTLKWTAIGVQIAGCIGEGFAADPIPDWICTGPIVSFGSRIVDNSTLKAVKISVFGPNSGISLFDMRYEDGTAAIENGQNTWANGYTMIEPIVLEVYNYPDVSDWHRW